ncbi:MAG: extracellular solute-binding protein [Chloroflexi bacterium]|nr:extracellular solute-binding protein [Chloroflexota bacterium]MCI0648103.1 extracellular solute-binding protein [Chloroflexota bacterium]MCI0729056.1 extracellular solute-binding protein [Chloroflexota bacterium]
MTRGIIFCLFLGLVLGVGCQPALLEPPRLATQTAQAQASPTATVPPLILEQPTPTAGAAISPTLAVATEEATPSPIITLWANETSPAHEALLEQMAGRFQETTGIQVEVILVSPSLLPELIRTAAVSNNLPDLVLHPVEYSIGWVEDGILDPGAATAVVEQLGRETFDAGALAMVTVDEEAGLVAAIPSDGYQQLIIYRTDWFEEQGLAPPESYEALLAAAERFFEPDSVVSGLVIPTDSDLITTQQAFEQIAAANGCELVDRKGEVTLLHPACLEALDFYFSLVNQYSPLGVQTDISALNAYLAGRTGIIIASPSVLPKLAGLDEQFPPTCPQCATPTYLAENSGFITELQGMGQFATTAGLGEMTLLGITGVAEAEAAALARYWFEEGYLEWLALEPERKAPLRLGTAGQPQRFIEAWGNLPLADGGPSLNDIYGQDLVDRLGGRVATTDRWGFDQGQGALVALVYEDLTLSPLLQEMLSGYFTSSQTIVEMYRAVVDLIPNYAYPLPTSTPEP